MRWLLRAEPHGRHPGLMPRLLIATKNAHKAVEIGAILDGAWVTSNLTAYPDIPAPRKTGMTFEENATIKALAASRLVEGFVLSDDSGLEVDALGGAPGVYSARYAGPVATDGEKPGKTSAGTGPPRRSRQGPVRAFPLRDLRGERRCGAGKFRWGRRRHHH